MIVPLLPLRVALGRPGSMGGILDVVPKKEPSAVRHRCSAQKDVLEGENSRPMYLYWKPNNPAAVGAYNESYAISLMENRREPGKATPRRHTVVYLGSVQPNNRFATLAHRVRFWENARARLASAVAAGKLTEEQAQHVAAELAQCVPVWALAYAKRHPKEPAPAIILPPQVVQLRARQTQRNQQH